MIALEAGELGTILPVKVHAGARRNEIRGSQAGMLRVSVTQAPEKGKANKAILALLADTLGLPKGRIALVSGDTSPRKRFLVSGISVDELRSRLEPLLEDRDPA